MATSSDQNQPTTSSASLILVRKSRRTRNRSVNQTTYHGHATALFCRLPLSADAERDGFPDFVQRIVHHGSGNPTFALNGDRVHIVHIYEGSRTAQPDLFHAGPCFDDNDYAEGEGYNLGRISDAEDVEIFEDPSGDLVRETLWNGNCHYKDCLDGYIQCDDGFASGVSWMLQNLRPLKLDYVRKLENLRGLLFRTTGKTLCPYCMGLGLTIKLERLVVQSTGRTLTGLDTFLASVVERRRWLRYSDHSSNFLTRWMAFERRLMELTERRPMLFADEDTQMSRTRARIPSSASSQRNDGLAASRRQRSRLRISTTTLVNTPGSPGRQTTEDFSTVDITSPISDALSALNPPSIAGAYVPPPLSNPSITFPPTTRSEVGANLQASDLLNLTHPQRPITPSPPPRHRDRDNIFGTNSLYEYLQSLLSDPAHVQPNTTNHQPRSHMSATRAILPTRPLSRPGSQVRPYSWFVNARDRVLDNACTICLESYGEGDEVVELGCGHFFHRGCVDCWMEVTCPVCRRVFADGDGASGE